MNIAVQKLQEMCDLAGSQKAVADELLISPSYLCDVLKGRRDVSDALAHKLGFVWTLTSLNPMPHPEGAVDVPPLVMRELKEGQQ
jgi:hypothetical protein